MGGFFSIDGPFYRIGNILADIMILSFLWIVFSIPLVTIGASTTALFYVTTRRISNREGYLFRDFWKSFKTNFKQATLVFLILLLVSGILITNIMNIGLVGNMSFIILPFQICFLVELALISIYIFPIIARFQLGLKDVFKTAFFMANKHLLTSLMCLVTVVAIFLVILMYELFAVVAIGCYGFAISYFLVRVFKKYRPEIDVDDETLAAMMLEKEEADRLAALEQADGDGEEEIFSAESEELVSFTKEDAVEPEEGR